MNKMMNLSPSTVIGSNAMTPRSGSSIIKDDPASRLKAAFAASADVDNSSDGSFGTTTLSIAGSKASSSSKSKKNKAQVASKKKKSK